VQCGINRKGKSPVYLEKLNSMFLVLSLATEINKISKCISDLHSVSFVENEMWNGMWD
jgi:hypothetical protein